MTSPRHRIAVVVLGPLGRSPRMINHARSLAGRGYDVSLIGYPEAPSGLPAGVRVCLLESGLEYRGTSRLLFLTTAALRMSILFARLIVRLIAEKPRWILVQNPPSFPTLVAAWMCARLGRGRLIVDWHNYGYTMLALRLGNHAVVRGHEWYEGRAGRLADAHLCVSAAMRDDLARRWGIDARVLYDRPVEFLAARESSSNAKLIVVCPCGWTVDENVDLLLDALALFSSAPALKLYLTGDGPLRGSFEARIEQLRRAGFDIVTGFLPEAEYRDLLRSADLGLSLHTSSSGLDLAMKVSDLFAARVPVCAWDYGACLREQIDDGVTGFIFQTAQDLSALLRRLIADPKTLRCMREHVEEKWQETWDEAWERAVPGVLA